ncbi:MAG: hypothetical protein EOM45_13065 [Clostridia bacterium]|nr:hypothetical protein [Clostridia bacterium]
MEYNASGDHYTCKAGAGWLRRTPANQRASMGSSPSSPGIPARGVRILSAEEVVHKGQQEKIQDIRGISAKLAEYRKVALENITTDFGTSVRVNRSIQVEGAFAQINANLSFRRFICFGSERTTTEWMLMFLAMNAIRLGHRMTKNLTGIPFWYKSTA